MQRRQPRARPNRCLIRHRSRQAPARDVCERAQYICNACALTLATDGGRDPVNPFPSQYEISRLGMSSNMSGNVPDKAQKLQLNCTTLAKVLKCGSVPVMGLRPVACTGNPSPCAARKIREANSPNSLHHVGSSTQPSFQKQDAQRAAE